jgi:hypothetical protein
MKDLSHRQGVSTPMKILALGLRGIIIAILLPIATATRMQQKLAPALKR